MTFKGHAFAWPQVMLSLYKAQTFLDSTCFSVLYDDDAPNLPSTFPPVRPTFRPTLATKSFDQLKRMPSPAPLQAHGSPNTNHPQKPGVFFDSRLLGPSPKINRVDSAPISIPTAQLNNAA